MSMSAAKLLVSVVLSGLMVGAVAAPTFALVSFDGDGHALLISERAVQDGTQLYLQIPEGMSRSRCCMQLKARDLRQVNSEHISPTASNQLTPRTLYRYRLPIAINGVDMPFVGIAVVGAVRRVEAVDEQIKAIAEDGSSATAYLCTSSEGVHLKAVSGQRLVTHLYLGMGYEIESPTCR